MRVGLWSDSFNRLDDENIRDGYAYRWHVLLENFKSKSISLDTFHSCNEIEKFDILIENGIQGCNHNQVYLIINESPLVRPQDWSKIITKGIKKYLLGMMSW